MRAFDDLSARVKEVPAPLRPVIRSWVKLSAEQKGVLIDLLIAAVAETGPTIEEKPKASRKKSPAKKKPRKPASSS
jgi:hypothetical protein